MHRTYRRRAAGVLTGFLLLASAANAHQAPSGWEYDAACCSGTDCAWIAGGAVREVAGGYQINVAPGTHPMVPLGSPGVTGFVAHGDPRIRPSGDTEKHICIIGGRILCIYVPPGGV